MLVGHEEKSFLVHEGVITKRSDFFRAACNHDFKESRERTIRLPTMSVATFENFLHWLYTGEVLVMTADEDGPDDRDGHIRFVRLAKLYVAADIFDARVLRNHVIDEMVNLTSITNRTPGIGAIRVAYNMTPSTSKLRQLIVDNYLCGLKAPDWLEQNRTQLPQDFIFDLAVGKIRLHRGDGAMISKSCKYHEHADDNWGCS